MSKESKRQGAKIARGKEQKEQAEREREKSNEIKERSEYGEQSVKKGGKKGEQGARRDCTKEQGERQVRSWESKREQAELEGQGDQDPETKETNIDQREQLVSKTKSKESKTL